MRHNCRFPIGQYWLLMACLLTLLSVGQSFGQYCGAYQAVPANGNNPDSLIFDRFGNAFDFDDLNVPLQHPAGAPCNPGYFHITWVGNPPMDVQNAACEALTYVSTVIQQRQGVTDCGSFPGGSVEIQVGWINFITPDPDVAAALGLNLSQPLPPAGAGIGTPFYSNPTNATCKEVVLERPFIKINGGRPNPTTGFDGRIVLNSAILWNLNTSAVVFNGTDMFTTVLHETMHVLGYASRMGSTDVFTLWDQTLRIVDEYVQNGGSANVQDALLNPSNCKTNCWQKAGGLSAAAVNSCTGPGPDVVVGDAAIAPIAGDPGVPPNPVGNVQINAFNNMLSHLSTNCNGQNVPYVMRPGFFPGEFQRVMTLPEQQIFCALGYSVPGGSCDGCYNIAHPDREYNPDAACCFITYFGCAGETIEILDAELLCNDISNGAQSVTRVWQHGAGWLSIVRNTANTGWLVTIPANPTSSSVEMRYTVAGCDCRMHNASFGLFIDKQCPPCTNTPDPCDNLICNGNFEAFTNTQSIESRFGWPLFFEPIGGSSIAPVSGSPDVNVTNTGNHYLHMGNFSTTREGINLPLDKCIEPGCKLTMSMDLSDQSPTNTILEVWGSPDRPCPATVLGAGPINNNCNQTTLCTPGNTLFEPICIFASEFESTSQYIDDNNPGLQPAGTFTWENQTTEDVCFLTMVPSHGHQIYVDNIVAEITCEPTVTCNSMPPYEVCAGGISTIRFKVCATDVPDCLDFTLVTPTITLPAGWQVVGGNHNPAALAEGECAIFDYQIQVIGASVGSMADITLSGTAAGLCTSVDWSCTSTVTVNDCGSGVFTCPCGPGGLNIDASSSSPFYSAALGGTLYSDLEAVFNYDQNNDGIIGQTEHNDCIAIKGRLILDQNLSFNGCDNIQMQPCSEIVVGTNAQHTTANFDNNFLHSCEIMWKGITVSARSTLNFNGNTIRDAQFAITAVGSFVIGNPPTRLIASGNTFSNNHVGVIFPGAGFTIVNHSFTNNTFNNLIGQFLLPPCDAGLPNYSSTWGCYAGIVTLGTPLNVGTGGTGGLLNTFSYVRNGVISEGATTIVTRADFQNIIGAGISGPPSYANASGNGVASNGGFITVLNSNFNTVRRGVYANNNQLVTVQQNTMTAMWRGVDLIAARRTNISDNPSIGFTNRGIAGLDLVPTTGTDAHLIANNTNLFISPFPGSVDIPAPPYPAAIDIDQAQISDLGNARIRGNHFFSRFLTDGIRINKAGGWDIDENIIDFTDPMIPQFSNIGVGIRLTNSNGNYLYHNTINDADPVFPASTGFHVTTSTLNRFCCNITQGNRIGTRFTGGCQGTEWRVTDMHQHQFSIYCDPGTTIGQQYDYGNLFNVGSGTAFHGGTTTEVLGSQFRVVNMTQPHWPTAVDAPNSMMPFFIQGGYAPSCTAPCIAIPYSPGDGEERDVKQDEGDSEWSALVGNDRGIQLMPNPATDRVTISGLPVSGKQTARITLFNAQGVVCLRQSTTESEFDFSVAALPAGIYLCQVSTAEKGAYTLKLLVTH